MPRCHVHAMCAQPLHTHLVPNLVVVPHKVAQASQPVVEDGVAHGKPARQAGAGRRAGAPGRVLVPATPTTAPPAARLRGAPVPCDFATHLKGNRTMALVAARLCTVAPMSPRSAIHAAPIVPVCVHACVRVCARVCEHRACVRCRSVRCVCERGARGRCRRHDMPRRWRVRTAARTDGQRHARDAVHDGAQRAEWHLVVQALAVNLQHVGRQRARLDALRAGGVAGAVAGVLDQVHPCSSSGQACVHAGCSRRGARARAPARTSMWSCGVPRNCVPSVYADGLPQNSGTLSPPRNLRVVFQALVVGLLLQQSPACTPRLPPAPQLLVPQALQHASWLLLALLLLLLALALQARPRERPRLLLLPLHQQQRASTAAQHGWCWQWRWRSTEPHFPRNRDVFRCCRRPLRLLQQQRQQGGGGLRGAAAACRPSCPLHPPLVRARARHAAGQRAAPQGAGC